MLPVMPQRHAVSADQAAFDQAQAERHRQTPAKDLVAHLVAAARRMNLTVAPPAHIKPAVWSEPVDQSGQVVIAAGNPAAYQTVCQFTTPPGRWARIEHYGAAVISPSTYNYGGSLLWGFRLNGRMLDMGMSDWGEQRGSMVFLRPTVIIMPQEQITLEFMVRRAQVTGVPLTVQMCFRGWTWRLRNNYEGTQGSVTAY